MMVLARWIVLLGLLCSFSVSAIEPDAGMSPELEPFYRALESSEAAAELTGRKFTLNLSLKFASERHLIFHDAYVRVDEVERYQIAKWQFEPEVTAPVAGLSDQPCRVTFVVEAVRVAPPYQTMPHLLVRVLKIEPLEQGAP